MGPLQAGALLGRAGPLPVAVQAAAVRAVAVRAVVAPVVAPAVVDPVVAGPPLGQVAGEAQAAVAGAQAPVQAARPPVLARAEGRPCCRGKRSAKHHNLGCSAEAGAAQHPNPAHKVLAASHKVAAWPKPSANRADRLHSPTPFHHTNLQSHRKMIPCTSFCILDQACIRALSYAYYPALVLTERSTAPTICTSYSFDPSPACKTCTEVPSRVSTCQRRSITSASCSCRCIRWRQLLLGCRQRGCLPTSLPAALCKGPSTFCSSTPFVLPVRSQSVSIICLVVKA